jgi:hypothetical protein
MSISKSKIFDRISLKNFFKNGTIPNEKHFSFLIDSMTNKQDDGINKDTENGLILSATGKSKKILTIFKKVDDLDPFYFIEIDENGTNSLKLRPNLNLTEDDFKGCRITPDNMFSIYDVIAKFKRCNTKNAKEFYTRIAGSTNCGSSYSHNFKRSDGQNGKPIPVAPFKPLTPVAP